MASKYKNIVGTGFPSYVTDQIQNRSELVKKKDRRTSNINGKDVASKDLLWLTNRNCWFRLSSGANSITKEVDVNSQEQKEELALFAKNAVKPLTEDENNAINLINQQKFVSNDDLAKKYVMQGGTIENLSSISDRNNNKTTKIKTKTTFDEIYTKNNEKFSGADDLGYKPMPGITDVSVGTKGKWQTMLETDISFIAYNMEQLEIVHQLYMSLGVHVFLEWGHTPYIDKDGKIETTPINPLDFFSQTNTEDILKAVEKKKKDYSGNYGATLGRVVNYSFNANTDGSYSCSITVIGAGSMLESLKINKASGIDFNDSTKENNDEEYISDLENALGTIKETLKALELGIITKTVEVDRTEVRGGSGNYTTSEDVFQGTVGNKFFKSKKVPFYKKELDKETGEVVRNPDGTEKDYTNWKGNPTELGKIEYSYANTLNNIYGSTSYKGYNFNPGPNSTEIIYNIPSENNSSPQRYGNPWQVSAGLETIGVVDPIPPEFFYGFTGRFTKGTGTVFGKASIAGFTLDRGGSFNEYHYLTFGHILTLIQHLCVFNSQPKAKGEPTPIIYIDYNPDNTLMKTGVLRASINPSVCLTPLQINIGKNSGSKEAFQQFFEPLATDKDGLYDFQTKANIIKNKDKNLFIDPALNKVNNGYSEVPNAENTFSSNKLMYVLVEIDNVIKILNKLEQNDSDKNVDLITFLNALLDDINVSLGKINNFRAFYDDNSCTVRIIDENLLPQSERDNNKLPIIEIPNFGLDSLTYDYSFASSISNKLAAQITIASQGAGGTQDFSDDALSYSYLNGEKIIDRFANHIVPSLLLKQQGKSKLKTLKARQSLFDALYNIYALDALDTSAYASLSNLYETVSGINIKYYPGKAGTTVVPLTFSIVIDGITGIMPYNVFRVPESRLPIRYQNKNVGFIVFSINHTFSGNQWKTSLDGQMVNLDNNSLLNPNPPRKINKKSKKVPPKTQTGNPTGYNPNVPGDQNIKPNTSGTPEKDEGQEKGPEVSTIELTPGNLIPIEVEIVNFIKPLESSGGPKLEAYKDRDYTVSPATWKYRIGYGSDTITSPNGKISKVKSSSRITVDMANDDIERRVKTQFIPAVTRVCNSNSVNFETLPKEVKIVFVDCAYNYGTLWNQIVLSYKRGGKQGLINELQSRINKGESQVPHRRAAEIRKLGGTPRNV